MKGSHISLFSGVGMTDLAVERAGFKTIATAEVDPFCRRVLQARNPGAIHFHDVREVKMTASASHRIGVDPAARKARGPLLISGGFPCQDVSSAGTGAGLAGARSGLWGEFARVIREFQPEYVFIENSPMLRTRGLATILADLWSMGYDAQWDCIPAAAVGAPHLRDRIFVLAQQSTGRSLPVNGHYIGTADRSLRGIVGNAVRLTRCGYMQAGDVYTSRAATPVNEAKLGLLAKPGNRATRLYPTPTKADGSGGPGTTPKREGGKNLRTVIAEEHGNGRLNPTFVEWMMGLPFGWTDPECSNDSLLSHPGWGRNYVAATSDLRVPNRSKRIRALGNGMVPQAAAIPLGWLP